MAKSPKKWTPPPNTPERSLCCEVELDPKKVPFKWQTIIDSLLSQNWFLHPPVYSFGKYTRNGAVNLSRNLAGLCRLCSCKGRYVTSRWKQLRVRSYVKNRIPHAVQSGAKCGNKSRDPIVASRYNREYLVVLNDLENHIRREAGGLVCEIGNNLGPVERRGTHCCVWRS